MKPTWRLYRSAFLMALLMAAVSAGAGDAVFSQNGGKIYLIDRQEAPGQLYSIDLGDKELLPSGVPDLNGEPILSIDRSNAGFILCLTRSACFAWDVDKGATVEVCRVPKDGQFVELGYDSSTGLIAFVIRFETEDGFPDWQLWVQPKGADGPAATRVRRVETITGMAFDPKGDFYFGSGGDLWHGSIREIKPDETPGGLLQAYRFAPLATLETDDATPSQIGVRSVVAAGPWLYAHVERMGGSGWGNVVRLAKPKIEEAPEGDPGLPFALSDRIDAYRHALESVVDLGENGSLAFLAASPDGKLVYFQASRDGGEVTHWLVRDHGEPEELRITTP